MERDPALHPPRHPLTDGVVVLRPWRADDAARLSAAWADEAVSRWTEVPIDCDEDAARRWIEGADRRLRSGVALDLAVTSAGTTAPVIGEVGLAVDRARRRAGVGYWVSAAERGRGLATRAVRLFCGWVADELPVELLAASVDISNPGSASVLERSGFTLVAERDACQAWARRVGRPGSMRI